LKLLIRWRKGELIKNIGGKTRRYSNRQEIGRGGHCFSNHGSMRDLSKVLWEKKDRGGGKKRRPKTNGENVITQRKAQNHKLLYD